LKRFISRTADCTIGLFNTRCYAYSRSQMRFLIREGRVDENKIAMIGENSLSGVDLNRFNPQRWTSDEKQKIRKELSVSATSKVIVFVGRIAKDKGITELIGAFESLVRQGYNLDLVLVGPFDQERGGDATISASELRRHARVHLTGYTASPEYYLSIADIFCLPSYREGFGTVVIEAAAMGLPAVGTHINGLIDAIVDGETGILVPPGDETALTGALQRLLDEPDLLLKMGQNARRRCIQHFSAEIINHALAAEYECLLKLN
jgi:glycosyltransferase involved in cell wall biosynthesis